VAGGQASPEYYPHQPFRWVMRHLTDGKTLRDITTPNTPSFILRVADLFPGQPKPDPHSPHATHMYLSYWCPASNPGKSYCNSPGWGYCGHWGCETIVTDARPSGPGWDPQEPDKFLQFTWAPAGCKTPVFIQGNFYRNHYKIPKIRKCTHYNMTVLQPNHPGWTVGKVWTAVLQGSKQWVNVQITRLQPSAPRAVGPNKVIKTFQIGAAGSESDPILSMLEATFLSLNESNPNLTNSCWLCYDVKPPFYEGVALDIPFSYSTAKAPHQCRWDTPRKGITLSQVTGRGRCFGNATLASERAWAVPSASGMWVCQRSGVSPCVFLAKFSTSNDFCVQVLIVPRVLYHSAKRCTTYSRNPAGSTKEILTAADDHWRRPAEDEKSISFLEKSVSSLSEVVLQNRRGLDLLLMQQGRPVPALKEECCFYVDHTGVHKDKRREAQQGWFESWFNQSPWLTTLISTLAGPLAMLLLGITFGPCLLNKLVSLVRARLERNNILDP
uniref:Uncharacterized protein n=1 Tax=Geospiza parvula TaxID=87175 RepID=A0A8U8CHJ6_GEOPR